MTRKRKNSLTVEFYGMSELLKKIATAEGNVERAVEKAVVKGMEAPKKDMIKFMDTHYFSGATEKSMTESKIEWVNGKATYVVGYAMKGGIAALFLDVGTPKQRPYFFIHNALEKNVDRIKEAQQEALEEIFRELM